MSVSMEELARGSDTQLDPVGQQPASYVDLKIVSLPTCSLNQSNQLPRIGVGQVLQT